MSSFLVLLIIVNYIKISLCVQELWSDDCSSSSKWATYKNTANSNSDTNIPETNALCPIGNGPCCKIKGDAYARYTMYFDTTEWKDLYVKYDITTLDFESGDACKVQEGLDSSDTNDWSNIRTFNSEVALLNVITYYGTQANGNSNGTSIRFDMDAASSAARCFFDNVSLHGTRMNTNSPTFNPTPQPTNNPTSQPTNNPTSHPTALPTQQPTTYPTSNPSVNPSLTPTKYPTIYPTNVPTVQPTIIPSDHPSTNPTMNPTYYPTTSQPTNHLQISPAPTVSPTIITTETSEKLAFVTTEVSTDEDASNQSLIEDNILLVALILIIIILLLCIIFMLLIYLFGIKKKRKRSKKFTNEFELNKVASTDADGELETRDGSPHVNDKQNNMLTTDGYIDGQMESMLEDTCTLNTDNGNSSQLNNNVNMDVSSDDDEDNEMYKKYSEQSPQGPGLNDIIKITTSDNNIPLAHKYITTAGD